MQKQKLCNFSISCIDDLFIMYVYLDLWVSYLNTTTTTYVYTKSLNINYIISS